MYTIEGNEVEGLELIEPTRRRRHSREFKEKVVRAAMQPNVSIAAVALHYRLNANLVRRWVVARQKPDVIEPAAVEALAAPQAAFVRLQLEASSASAGLTEIRIEVRLQPLVDALREELLQRHVLHADETPVQMLSHGKGKTHRAYRWAYSTTPFADLKAVVYDFAGSRAGEHARKFMGAWCGKLMCDDYGGYKAGFELGITEIGCVAHPTAHASCQRHRVAASASLDARRGLISGTSRASVPLPGAYVLRLGADPLLVALWRPGRRCRSATTPCLGPPIRKHLLRSFEKLVGGSFMALFKSLRSEPETTTDNFVNQLKNEPLTFSYCLRVRARSIFT